MENIQPMEDTQEIETAPRNDSRAFKVVSVFVILLLAAANIYLYRGQQQLQAQVSELASSVEEQVSMVRETSALDTGKTRREIEALRERLSSAIQKAETSVGRAKVEAKKHAEQLAQRLASKQEEQQKQIASRISEVRNEATTKFEQVNTDVGNVRTEVASTQQELEEVVSRLQQVRGDMGVMSGRIATNGEELAALKALGERNYFEFDITKSKEPARVGDIQIALKKTDRKRNKFTMNVLADDKWVQKKHKTINEPIQFYVGGRGGQPYEIVVNKVEKRRIVGYLAVPKVELALR